MKYYDARQRIKTGDVILFSGGGIVSATIQWLTRSKWSHVGMAYQIPEHDLLLCWESTTLSKLSDIEYNTPRQGVQLVALSERLKGYDGQVAYRPLVASLTSHQVEQLRALRSEVKGRDYEDDHLELIRSVYDGPWGENAEDLSSLFCSELIGEAYKRMGLLEAHVPSNEYTPAEFAVPGFGRGILGSVIPIEE